MQTAPPRPQLPRIDAWMRPARLRAHAALLALCLWGVLAAGVSTPGLRDRSGLLKGSDFLQFYVFASLAREGHEDALYDYSAHVALAERRVPESRGTTFLPVYGPQVALLFAPLTHLPYAAALTVWVVTSALLYAICIALVWRRCPQLARHGPLVALFAIAYPPLFSVIGHGQSSALALACFTGAYLALRGGRSFSAGLALGCLAYKPQLALGAGIVLLLAREWRIVAGALAAGGAQLAIGALWAGPEATLAYLRVLASLGELAPTLGFKLHQMHCLRSFFDLLLPAAPAKMLWAAAAIAAVGIAYWIWRSATPLPLRYAALLVATARVNPHQYMYDLVFLAPAGLLLADAALSRPAAAWAPGLRVLLYAAFVLPALGPLARLTHLQLSVVAMTGILLLLLREALAVARGEAGANELPLGDAPPSPASG